MSSAIIQKIFPPNLAYRNFIFIPLFFAFYITLKIFEPTTFFLEHFNGRSISLATSIAIDIGKRVSIFYKGFVFVTILILLFTRIVINIRNYFTEGELLLANGISLAGFCLLLFQLLGADLSNSIHFIFALLIICLAGFVAHLLKKREEKDFTTIFLWTVVVCVSLFFLQWQISNFIFGKTFLSLPKILVLVGVPVYILFTHRLHLDSKIFKSSHPLIYLPILSFLSVELFMIFNQHGINLEPKLIYAAGLVIILMRMFFLFKNNDHQKENFLSSIFRNRIPWILAGMACISFYQPIIQPDIDWFEDANHVLPLHQMFSFGKIPFLDSFSSHALSDFGFGWLYCILNGNDPMGVFLYRFLISVIVLLIAYFFVYKLSGDGFLAIWITIAYPYADLLIPSYFNFVPLVALTFISLYERQTEKRYIYFFFSLMFLILWRIDLGLSTLVAGIGGLLFLILFVDSFKFQKKYFVKGLTFALGILFIFFIFAFIQAGPHLFESIKDILAYTSSFQSYGIKDLAIQHDMKYFFLYYIFPSSILLILIYCIYRITGMKENDNKTFVFCLALIFLGIFYFSNFQRGLVRHTLAEQWDAALTSYGFFIIASMLFIKVINKNIFVRFFYFFVFSSLLISNYVFTAPNLNQNNFYSSLTDRLDFSISYPVTKEKINRIVEDPAYQKSYAELSIWMKNNFSDKSTFLDFSNTPMLYYYTNRVVPNYFDQIPHTAHNDYLQNRFIAELKNFEIPITIFSSVPPNYWDNLDGIPNAIRHYRISEYIYRNYSPSFIINNHSIWLRKGIKIQNNKNEIYYFSLKEMISSGIIMKDSNEFVVGYSNANLNYTFKDPIVYDVKKIYLTTDLTSDKECELMIQYRSADEDFNDQQKKVFKIHKGKNSLWLLIDSENKNLGAINFVLPQNVSMKLSRVKIFSSDNYIDLFSESPVDFQLRWIPFMWGTYDQNYLSGNIKSEQIIFSGSKYFKSRNETKVDFIPTENKDSGNYILLSARVKSGIETEVKLNYGDSDQVSGSFNFIMKNDTLLHDYLIRISSQYGWYTKRNNWFSILPVNDIEIVKAEILKGD